MRSVTVLYRSGQEFEASQEDEVAILLPSITQGSAGPDEFRTAPLRGVGQRIFFLHDGRATDLVKAIEAHRSRDSEGNRIIDQFDRLRREQQQDIVNFLRAL